MDKRRCAVIGIGGIGVWHGEMMNATGRLEVVAVCDANEAMRAKAKEKFPNAKFYTSHRQMLAKEHPDLVGVITPHNLHAPLAIDALRHGANVIVEKPMATRYEDSVAMIKAAKAHKRFLTVFHNRRLDGWFLAARSVIEAGLLGELVELNAAINYRPSPATWRGYKAASGGLLFDWGAHLVDYLLHLSGSEVKAVSGFYFRSKTTNPKYCEDHGTLRMHFKSGAIGNVSISGADRSQPLRYRLVGMQGTLTDEWNWGENDKLKVYTRLGGGEPAVMEVQYQKTVPQKFYDNIADHLTKGTRLLVSAESAATVINVLCAAERSSKRGGVPVPLA